MARLTFVQDARGRLVIGSTVRRTITLRLDPAAAVVAHAGEEVPLPWGDFGEPAWVGGPSKDRWFVTWFATGRWGDVGISLWVSGAPADATRAVHQRTMSLFRRFVAWDGTGVRTGHSLPLLPANTVRNLALRQRLLVGTLCEVLADRADLRSRLADPTRTARLAHDLGASSLPQVHEWTGGLRDSTDIATAMREAGARHRFGRPLSAASVMSLGDAVERTIEELERNPYREGRTTDRHEVEHLVRKHYVDVEPWPFAALVDDDG